ncbi:MAG: phosphoribosylaminoimidazolesuccinocarboxamide synthase [bacterium]
MGRIKEVAILRETHLPGLKLLRRGKVRDVYEAGRDRLLMVTTDRVSAFDVVMREGVRDKGRVLTQLSEFWFKKLESMVPHHLISTKVSDFPKGVRGAEEQVAGRTMLVRRTRPIEVECVVRGYLDGSAWTEYKERGAVAGEKLPAGLRQRSPLPEPIFTPATKSQTGHDENISFAQAANVLGEETAERLRETSLAIYRAAHAELTGKGLVLSDTKFEFGWRGEELLLIDEALTPDSSRFWGAESYHPDRKPVGFDKQFLRDYLKGCDWNFAPPPPRVPEKITEKLTELYRTAFRRITGEEIK